MKLRFVVMIFTIKSFSEKTSSSFSICHAESFTIYEIQKRASYGVFRKEYGKLELEKGRRMYRFILGRVLAGAEDFLAGDVYDLKCVH